MLLVCGAPRAQTPPVSAPVPQLPPASAPGGPTADPAYRLGPGDSARVTVWTGNEYLESTLTVSADGTILIPFLVNKVVKASGLSASELRDLIRTELQAVFRQPVVQTLITGFQSKRALLVGEAATPGQYAIAGETPLLDFVLQHGGFTPRANLTAVQLNRADGTKAPVNLYDIILKGDRAQNLPLAAGDIVFIPSVETIGKKYFMLGELRNPGLLQSQDDLTLLEAIARSGTFLPSARASQVFVVRAKPGGESEVTEIAFADLYRKGDLSRNIVLQSGDIIFVPKNARTKMADVLAVVSPILSFMRDTLFILEFTRRER